MGKATVTVGNIRISGPADKVMALGKAADIATEASIEAQLAEAKLLSEEAPGLREAKSVMERLAEFEKLMGQPIGPGWEYLGSYPEQCWSFLGSGFGWQHKIRSIQSGRIALVAGHELKFFTGIAEMLEAAREAAKEEERALARGSAPKKAKEAHPTKPVRKSMLPGFERQNKSRVPESVLKQLGLL